MKERFRNILKHFIRGNLKDLYWKIHGNKVKNPGLPDNPRSFLFVCKGNVCRSPFAERLAIKIAENNGFKGTAFYSAGIEVSNSVSPPEEAILAAENFEVHLNGHKSRRITYDMMESFDTIIVMETRHLKVLRKFFPQFQEKVFLLPLFEKNSAKTGGNFYLYNIQDPYGQSLDQFHTCFRRIERCLKELFQELRHKDHMKI